MIINNFNFPDELLYWFNSPNTFIWIRKDLDNENYIKLEIGLTDMFVKNLSKIHHIGFRSENLKLREKKPFLHIVTNNQSYRLVSPVNAKFLINKKIEQNPNIILKDAYNEQLITCYEIQSDFELNSKFVEIHNLKSLVNELISNKTFERCENCPDLFQSTITRRK